MRFAAYWAPAADGALWRIACRWLGRDAQTTERFPAPDDRHAAITEDAARYGLHATLKAPIRLVDGATEADVVGRLAAVAARLGPFVTAPWVLADRDGFLALVPDPTIAAGRPPALHALADACVLALEPLRRPPDAAELARRRPERFGPVERENLMRFGYPHVFGAFFAHVTLTCRLDATVRAATAARLRQVLAAVPPAPWAFHDIALFVEPEAGAPFRLVRRFPLGVQR